MNFMIKKLAHTTKYPCSTQHHVSLSKLYNLLISLRNDGNETWYFIWTSYYSCYLAIHFIEYNFSFTSEEKTLFLIVLFIRD